MPTATVLPTLAPEQRGTPDDVERYRKIAEALLAQSQGGEPIEHWTQGVANMVEALMGGVNARKAGKLQREGEARGWEYLESMPGLWGGGGGGGYGGGETADVPGAEAVSSAPSADVMQHLGAPPADAATVYTGMIKRGLTPAQAAAFAGNVQQESSFNPGSHNVGEGAHGIIQWREGRFRNLQNFAAKQGKPWTDINTQMDFALWEMQNTETGPGQQFRGAQTLEDANAALKRYIRYGDQSYGTRLNNARRIGQLPIGETAVIPGAEPVGSEPSPDVAQFLGQPPAPPQASTAARQALIAKALGAPREAPADVAADVRKYYANEPPSPPPPRPPVRPPGEIADIPGTEPMSSAPSPEVMRHITGGGATPAGMGFTALPGPAAIRKPVQPPAMAPPPPPPISPAATRPPVQPPAMAPPPPPLAARVPQPRPAPPVAPAAPATTGTVAPMAPARPVPMPPVKNDYAQFPGRRPSVAPVRPGQLMNEPYPGVMSAQEFARAGQAAMRARAGGQPMAGAPAAPAAGQPQQPRRGLLQALLGRGGTPGASGAPTAPTGAPAAPGRAGIAAAMQDISFLPPAVQGAVLKRMFETGERPADYTLDNTRFSGVTNQPIASVPGDPPKREIREDANGIPRYVDTSEPVFGSDTAGGQAPVKITDVAAMRKEIQGLDSYKRYEKAAPVFNSLAESYGKNTRAGDLDFVYAMATIFDPESVVREGEQILVRNTANLPDQVVNGISSLMSGTGQLDRETRRNLYDVVHGRMQQYRAAADNALAPFPAIAERWSINPADIMPTPLELKALPGAEVTVGATFTAEEIAAIPENTVVEDEETHQRFRKQNGVLVPVAEATP